MTAARSVNSRSITNSLDCCGRSAASKNALRGGAKARRPRELYRRAAAPRAAIFPGPPQWSFLRAFSGAAPPQANEFGGGRHGARRRVLSHGNAGKSAAVVPPPRCKHLLLSTRQRGAKGKRLARNVARESRRAEKAKRRVFPLGAAGRPTNLKLTTRKADSFDMTRITGIF